MLGFWEELFIPPTENRVEEGGCVDVEGIDEKGLAVECDDGVCEGEDERLGVDDDLKIEEGRLEKQMLSPVILVASHVVGVTRQRALTT